MHRLAVAAVVSFVGASALAAENLPAPLAAVVAAERAFSKRCGEVGIRASFLEFFAPDAVSFAPDPGNARERLEKRPAPAQPPPILLEWAPEAAEINAAGDLGWTSGPYQLTDKRPGAGPPTHGYYFSLWKKQPDGAWKVVLDHGTGAPAAPLPTVARVAAPPAKGAGDPAAVQRSDEAFCAAAASGAGKAYEAALAPTARVQREELAPIVGDKAWRGWARLLTGVVSCKPAAAFASGGLGYTYGSWERRVTADGPVAEKGYYTRVWRLVGPTEWKIAVDVATVAK
jgi:ketosteroid isomerase-like protein